MNKKMLVL